MTTLIREETREELIEALLSRIRNYRGLLEDASVTEDAVLIEGIRERIREDRQQLAQLRSF